jgi:hypothetical protein
MATNKKPITEVQRAEFQANVIDVVNAFLDSDIANQLHVEFTQHLGDAHGHKPKDITTHYAVVKFPHRGCNHERLMQIIDLATFLDCKVSLSEDAEVVIWPGSARES